MISQVYNEDCINGMKNFPDNYFDLAVVDPPYGIGINHNIGRRKGQLNSTYKTAEWDNQPPPVEYFTELRRVSKNQIIWGANHFISRMPYDSSCWLLWDKLFSNDVSFASFEMAWTSFGGTTKKFTAPPCLEKDRIHPTQKPVGLYLWIMDRFAKTGDKILDTHMGSQNSRVAAYRCKLNYFGFEIDIDHFTNGCNRYEKITKNSLF